MFIMYAFKKVRNMKKKLMLCTSLILLFLCTIGVVYFTYTLFNEHETRIVKTSQIVPEIETTKTSLSENIKLEKTPSSKEAVPLMTKPDLKTDDLMVGFIAKDVDSIAKTATESLEIVKNLSNKYGESNPFIWKSYNQHLKDIEQYKKELVSA